MQGIERRSALSYAEFEREYLKPRRPVIITDALDACAARTRWTPQYFRERFGDRVVQTDSGEMSVATLIERVLDSSSPPPFLRERPIPWLLPELLEDLAPFPIYGRPNWLEYPFAPWPLLPSGFAGWPTRLAQTDINLTGANVRFPMLHLDRFHCHALILQWCGRKEFFAFAPEETDKLYPDESGDVSAISDPEHPDLERFPRFAEAKMLRFTLAPGELLFNPTGWWHTTRTHDVSIATVVSFGNASNWSQMIDRMWPRSWKGRLAFAPYAAYLHLLAGCGCRAMRSRIRRASKPRRRPSVTIAAASRRSARGAAVRSGRRRRQPRRPPECAVSAPGGTSRPRR